MRVEHRFDVCMCCWSAKKAVEDASVLNESSSFLFVKWTDPSNIDEMLSNMASVSQVMLERGVSGVNSVTSASEMTVVSEINILSDGTDVTGAISLPADILSSGECSGSVLAVCRWCLCGGSLSQLLPNFCNLVRATFGIQARDSFIRIFWLFATYFWFYWIFQLGNDEDVDQYLICGSCVDKLNDSYAFRCQIEDSHNKFKSLFIKSDVDFLNVPGLLYVIITKFLNVPILIVACFF